MTENQAHKKALKIIRDARNEIFWFDQKIKTLVNINAIDDDAVHVFLASTAKILEQLKNVTLPSNLKEILKDIN